MPITVTCPECSTRLTAPDDAAGKQTRCPKCRTPVVVPAVRLATPVKPATRHDTVADDSTDDRRPADSAATRLGRRDDEDDHPRRTPDTDDSDRPPRPRKGVPTSVVVLGAVVICVALACSVGLIAYSVTRTREKAPPPDFDPADVHETARWAGELLEPLHDAARIDNGVRRDDAMKAETKRIEGEAGHLVGRPVSWETGCFVFATRVSARPLAFGRDGKPVNDVPVAHERNPVALMLVTGPAAEPPGVRFGDHPLFRAQSIDVDVPGGMSKADAAALTDRVTVHATITAVEVGRYEDEKHKERFVLYVTLGDVRLTPPGK